MPVSRCSSRSHDRDSEEEGIACFQAESACPGAEAHKLNPIGVMRTRYSLSHSLSTGRADDDDPRCDSRALQFASFVMVPRIPFPLACS
jgi:hypothetical protein